MNFFQVSYFTLTASHWHIFECSFYLSAGHDYKELIKLCSYFSFLFTEISIQSYVGFREWVKLRKIKLTFGTVCLYSRLAVNNLSEI